jgi:hypothetical protein
MAAGMQACAAHAHRPAVGACRICKTAFCNLCRTRWRDKVLCPKCAEREMSHPDAGAVDPRVHSRLALWSLFLGLGGWLLLVGGLLPLLLVRNLSKELAILSALAVLLSAVPALLAAGQGAAAVRQRGNRMRAATTGLVLGGSQVGLLLGALLLTFWAN